MDGVLYLHSDIKCCSVASSIRGYVEHQLAAASVIDIVTCVAWVAFASLRIGLLQIDLICERVIKEKLGCEFVIIDSDFEVNMNRAAWIPTWVYGNKFCKTIRVCDSISAKKLFAPGILYI